MDFKIKVWRQPKAKAKGKFLTYSISGISPEQSFLEMMDNLNEKILLDNEEPIAFDNDCREGICGTCGAVVNGYPHGSGIGSMRESTLCQLHMRSFEDGETIVIEPFRARPFKVIKDVVVDRSAFDEIIQAGGYISARTGGTPDANAIPISQDVSELSMDAAACIGCGACVAACPNASAMLFASAKISHLVLLPQGKVERKRRVMKMVKKMDRLGFGNCSNHKECEMVCPKNISILNIARMNAEHLVAGLNRK